MLEAQNQDARFVGTDIGGSILASRIRKKSDKTKMSSRDFREIPRQETQESRYKEEKEKQTRDSDDYFAKERRGEEEVHQRHQSNYFPNLTNRLPARAKYRSRADIVCAILRVATEGAKKSRITSHAYVSYPHIEEYINFLLDNDMLKYNPESRNYHTTEKGHRLIKLYDEAKMIFNPR
jgi:predicted transcriptional regulator